MARVGILNFRGTGATVYYNVDAAVGDGCPNQREDVLLVQYLLKTAMTLPQFADLPGTAGKNTSSAVVVDGQWDKEWYVYLRNFQHLVKMHGHSVYVDGRVDPVPLGDRWTGSISQTQYTILYLNNAYAAAHPGDISRLALAGDCPAELSHLKVRFAGAN